MGVGTDRTTVAAAPGLLRPELQDAIVQRGLLPPGERLAPWVESFWSVAWDLRDASPFRAEVMTHPSVHLTVETGSEARFGHPMPAGLVHGVVTHRFSVELRGVGRTFGVKFRPGGFGAFTGEHVGAWSDRIVPLAAALGGAAGPFTTAVVEAGTDEERVAVVTPLLEARLPDADPTYDLVLGAVEAMRDDASLTTVEAVARDLAISERTLQRWFRRYVGVGPKWVLQRYRLHDAVSAIDAGDYDDLAGLAVGLGWFDQAHFTREFSALVGQSPAAYASRQEVSAGRSR